MKPSELREFIRPLISEEVSKQLPKLLFEMLGSQPKNVIKESEVSKKVMPPTGKKPISNSLNVVNPPAQRKPLKKFASNPILNEILNETVPGLPDTLYGNQPSVDLEGAGFSTIGDVRHMLDESIISSSEEPISEPIHNDPNPLSNLFNKNFKAILEKSKEKGLGGRNPSSVIQNW